MYAEEVGVEHVNLCIMNDCTVHKLYVRTVCAKNRQQILYVSYCVYMCLRHIIHVCRYNFPAKHGGVKFRALHKDATKTVDSATDIADVENFELDAARGHLAPYINKFFPVFLAAFACNSDCRIMLSDPGNCLYVVGYVSKNDAKDSTNSAVGILAGFNYALKLEDAGHQLATSAEQSTVLDGSENEQKFRARRRLILALMDSTAQLEVRAVMAAWNLLYECGNTMFSHDFQPIYLNQDVAFLENEPVFAALTLDATRGDSGSYAVNVLAHDYVYRGEALDCVTRYEMGMWYTRQKKPKKVTFKTV